MEIELREEHRERAKRECHLTGGFLPITESCLVAQALKEAFPGKSIKVGGLVARIDGAGWDLDPIGERIVRILPVDWDNITLPLTINITKRDA